MRTGITNCLRPTGGDRLLLSQQQRSDDHETHRILSLWHPVLPVFLGIFLYAVCFLGNFGVPTTIDGQPQVPFWQALAINILLLGRFAVQHSLMARRGFKR